MQKRVGDVVQEATKPKKSILTVFREENKVCEKGAEGERGDQSIGCFVSSLAGRKSAGTRRCGDPPA